MASGASPLRALLGRLFGSHRAPLELPARVHCFREILLANNAALGAIAEIQETLAQSRPLAMGDLRRLVTSVTTQTHRMASNLTRLTGARHKKITSVLEEIEGWIARQVETTPFLKPVGHVMPLAEIGAATAEVVGQKSAFLGEARRILGGRVPDGFATTVEAYRTFIEASGLGRSITALLATADLTDLPTCFSVSAKVTSLIESAPVPTVLADAIATAVAGVPGGSTSRFAVRSSALQEGGLCLSFAGQYRSLLNVPADGVVEAFKRVVASKYAPQALAYWVGRGFSDDDVAMCCCVIRMVEARAAGVLYSAWRARSAFTTLVQAVHGLGLSAVDGSARPDTYVIDRRRRRVVSVELGCQPTKFVSSAGEGTDKVALTDAAGRRILTDAEVMDLATLAWRLEAVLGTSVDVEWALTPDGRAFVLQVRPQPPHADEENAAAATRIAGAKALLVGGARASRGAACGPVCKVDSDLDMLRFPHGGVLVAREASPRLAVLLSRAAAVVADMGEVTGHLATVARELEVPALFATGCATTTLTPAAEVTVDANARVVYAGRVAEVLTAKEAPTSTRRSPTLELLAAVSRKITPLTLRDRLASGYSPRRCQTLHDIIRLCHQATLEAMFDLGDDAVRRGEPVRRLVSDVPMECRLFDLGGGIRSGRPGSDVTVADLTCVPMLALWKGMTDPRLSWRKERPVSARGFMSAVVNYNFDQDQRVRPMGEPSYIFVSGEYLNLNSRIGYHFSTIDACVSDRIESNHASFRFVGGSTGIEQRSRRAVLLERLLATKGFETDCKADLVNARIRRLPRPEMEKKMELLGLLLGYVNHLDMALVSDEVMEAHVEAFLAGDYGFKG